eukprot:6199895-Pleurochrysis_carterae.AAC.1
MKVGKRGAEIRVLLRAEVRPPVGTRPRMYGAGCEYGQSSSPLHLLSNVCVEHARSEGAEEPAARVAHVVEAHARRNL